MKFGGNMQNWMQIHSISVTPNTPPSTAPDRFFASSSAAAVRLVSPFTISSAQPENVRP